MIKEINTKLLNATDDMPRTDYPRPQWVRDSWYCLNGKWDFAFDFGASGEARGMVKNGEFPLTILVPFCPESKLSGIEHIDFIPAVWYRRTLNFDTLPKGRAILHFGAVDFSTKVWVNGKLCGTHKGGYTAFEMDITDALVEGENTLIVGVIDDMRSKRQAYGKQCIEYKSAACSYTRTTGIYQTVWLEFVNERYLKNSEMTPHGQDGTLDIRVAVANAADGDKVRLTAKYNGKVTATGEANVSFGQAATQLKVDEIHLWNPGAPEIYDLTLELVDKDGNVLDTVESYFALRDVSLTKTALTINGKVVYMRTILDQGFHPDGVYTAPSDDVLRRDIEMAMEIGFNGARFHRRVFEDRSLYWADMLGYIIWAEYSSIPNMGGPGGLYDLLPEWMEFVKQYYNHPCVIGWMCFNETYSRWELDLEIERMFYEITKTLDPYRPVIDSSGGIHNKTDMFDVHEYYQDPKQIEELLAPMLDDPMAFHSTSLRYHGTAPTRKENYEGQPYWLSEVGGAFFKASNEKNENGWGYGKNPANEDEFAERYEGLITVMMQHPRVCGFCYTQLTDIEQEQNGIFAYDRSPKFSQHVYDRIKKANEQIAAIEK